MAHQIKQMAYTGETPWHGLGVQLQENSSIEDWVKAADLEWKVQMSQVMFSPKVGNSQLQSYSGQFVIHKESDVDATPFGIVGKQYKPVQPSEVLEFYRELTESQGFQMETAGQLFNGQKIWALAKVSDGFELAGGDLILPYLLLTTGYDGLTATVGKFTTVRVVCNNTLSASLNNQESRVSIGHRSAFNPEIMKRRLGIATDVFSNMQEALEAMTRVKLNIKHADQLINQVMKIDENSRDIDVATANFLSRMFETGNYTGSKLESSDGTAFGLMNVVTEWFDHRKVYRNPNQKLNSIWYGQDEVKKQSFADAILALA